MVSCASGFSLYVWEVQVEYVKSQSNVGCTITPQHLLFNRTHMLAVCPPSPDCILLGTAHEGLASAS